jgi:hypothetical protein
MIDMNAQGKLTMKAKIPIPEPQGSTPMERLDWAFRRILTVPKDALIKKEKRIRQKRRGKAEKPT